MGVLWESGTVDLNPVTSVLCHSVWALKVPCLHLTQYLFKQTAVVGTAHVREGIVMGYNFFLRQILPKRSIQTFPV